MALGGSAGRTRRDCSEAGGQTGDPTDMNIRDNRPNGPEGEAIARPKIRSESRMAAGAPFGVPIPAI